MALLPVTLRRRLRSSGFSEEQTDALDEASEATAEAAREGLAKEANVRDEYHALRSDSQQLRSEIQQLRSEMQQLRSDMSALAWRLFAAIVTVILAATAAIMTAVAVWG